MADVGFLVNPIAGMGGRVGLKGTDGVAEEAAGLGAEPQAGERAYQAVSNFAAKVKAMAPDLDVHWLTCTEPMGQGVLRRAGMEESEIVHRCSEPTSARDTEEAARSMMERGVEVILFAGGDGTARDILGVVGLDTPILGIPAGVKMHSAVFGVDPSYVADILLAYLRGQIRTKEVEVMDLDEERYRAGEWNIRLYGTAMTPFEPNLVQTGKLSYDQIPDEEVTKDIAAYVVEMMEAEPDTVFILGPGSTVRAVGEALGLETTLLGIDAVRGGALVGEDLNEEGLLEILEASPEARLVISPIGAQGFILGRGNLQLSPEVVKRIGVRNILILATPAKLTRTPVLRVDTGDHALDASIRSRRYMQVIIGYHAKKMHPLQSA
jgi:predicted polyphosphate/ATP-dependent NAD kinase